MRRSTRSRGIATHVELLERRRLLAGAVNGVFPPDATYVEPGKFLYKTGGYLTKPTKGDAATIARNYFAANAAGFGLTAADANSSIVIDRYTDADNGITHVYLRQMFNGLEITNTDFNITVMRDGRILSAGGSFVPGAGSIKAQPIAPSLSATQALSKAANNIGLTLTQQPVQTSAARGIGQVQTFSAPQISSDEIPAQLHYVATTNGVQLAWDFVLHVPGGQHWYDTNVAATNGAMLWTNDFVNNFADPNFPGTKAANPNARYPIVWPDGHVGSDQNNTGRQPPTYTGAYKVYARPNQSPSTGPRTLEQNPWDLAASPFGWQDTDGDDGGESNVTAGNNVDAHEDRDANNSGGIQASGGTLNGDGSGSLSFDFPIDFLQEPTVATNQLSAITNLYYWNNVLHDIHYKYGFTEAARNFQQNNYGNGGVGNDRVQADAQDGSGINNANFDTPADGGAGRMQMYLFTSPTPDRDGDLDAQVIIHEYGHGVSNRLTGNGSGLNATQSGGMGEGWGDWWGLMLLQTDGSSAAQQAAYPVGTYVLNQPLNGPGIRRQPYSYNMAINTQTFANYGTGGAGQGTEVHDTGELWCGVLWDVAWNLINKWGFNPDVTQGWTGTSAGNGNIIALRLVMDGLKLQPSNPTFLQARDAILAADQALTGGQNYRELWLAFARRGLGFSASTSGASSSTFNEAFDLPLTFAPFVQSSSPNALNGLPYTSVTLNFSRPMDTTTFAVVDDVQSFTGPGGANLMSSITGFSWTNNVTLVINFSAHRVNGTYNMVIGPNLSATDGTLMDQDADNIGGEPTDAYTATMTKTGAAGPRVTAQTPTGTLFFATLTNIDLVFTEPMNEASFNVASDVASFFGPGGNDLKPSITGFSWLNNSTQLRINFTPQTTDGVYTISIGPGVLALVDNTPMDQNSNTVAGETPGDRYTGTMTLDRLPGPDAGGYEASPVPIQNIDLIIGQPGVTVLVNQQDNASNPLNLPAGNTFTYYGVTYSTIFASSNGLITFGTANTSGTNTDFTAAPTQPAIAVLWDDWRTDATAAGGTDSAVIYKITGNELVIEWSDVTNRSNVDGAATFQAILKLNTTGGRNGDIYLNYRDLVLSNATQTEGSSSTIGIKDTGTQGASRVFVAQNPASGTHPFIGTGKAIRFTATKASGIVFADNNGDGVHDAGETAVPFARIYADANNNLVRDPTELDTFADGSGAYTLSSLEEGNNNLRIDLGTYINTQPGGISLLMGEHGTGRDVGVFNTTITGTSGIDSYIVRQNAAQDRVEILVGGNLTYSILKSVLPTLRFDAGAGADVLTVNYVNGDPLSTFTTALRYTGSDADILAVTGTGTFNVSASQIADTPNLGLYVSNGAMMNLPNGLRLREIIITNADIVVPQGASNPLVTDSLLMVGAATLDLNDDDMILFFNASPLAMIEGLIRTARNGGAWDGNGITSTSAANRPAHDTTLGAMDAADYKSVYGANASFDGEPLAGKNAVLIKYTYYGDADFNGKVDGADYAHVDTTFNQETGTQTDIGGWFNGDFDYNNKVDGGDYALIDAAFNSQLGVP